MRLALASAVALALLLGCTSTRYTVREARAEVPSAVEPADAAPSDPLVVQIGAINAGALAVPALLLSLAPPGPVILAFDSPGGYVGAGLAFADIMKDAQGRGVVLQCVIVPRGLAASMGAYLFEQCDERYMYRTSSILFHSVSVDKAPGGTVDEVEKFAREMRELNDRLAVGIVGNLKISRKEFDARVRGDWWLGYEEALEVGAVDAVLEGR